MLETAMKITEATEADKLKALCELDGKPSPHTPTPEEIASGSYCQFEPRYLESFD
jgi:hypothetical protein